LNFCGNAVGSGTYPRLDQSVIGDLVSEEHMPHGVNISTADFDAIGRAVVVCNSNFQSPQPTIINHKLLPYTLQPKP